MEDADKNDETKDETNENGLTDAEQAAVDDKPQEALSDGVAVVDAAADSDIDAANVQDGGTSPPTEGSPVEADAAGDAVAPEDTVALDDIDDAVVDEIEETADIDERGVNGGVPPRTD